VLDNGVTLNFLKFLFHYVYSQVGSAPALKSFISPKYQESRNNHQKTTSMANVNRFFLWMGVFVLGVATCAGTTKRVAAAEIAVYNFQNSWQGAKETNFATFAANSPSTDTDLNSTASLLSNKGFNSGGYASFTLKDSVAGTSIFSTSNTPDVGMNVGGANASTPTNYVSFTVTPDMGYSTTFESLSFYTDTNAGNDVYDVQVSAIIDSMETTLGSITHSSGSTNAPVQLFNIDFTDFMSADPTEFRIYAYNTVGSSNAVRFDDITLNGTTSANVVPEPTAVAVWSLLGLVGFGYCRVRRKK
jgi:hypothetical protein